MHICNIIYLFFRRLRVCLCAHISLYIANKFLFLLSFSSSAPPTSRHRFGYVSISFRNKTKSGIFSSAAHELRISFGLQTKEKGSNHERERKYLRCPKAKWKEQKKMHQMPRRASAVLSSLCCVDPSRENIQRKQKRPKFFSTLPLRLLLARNFLMNGFLNMLFFNSAFFSWFQIAGCIIPTANKKAATKRTREGTERPGGFDV